MHDSEVVVLAAMTRELRPLVRALRMRSELVGGLPAWRASGVVAAAVGIGPQRAGAGATQVLDEIRARRVLVVGVAGALDPALRVGDVVRPEAVVDVRTARVLVVPPSNAARSRALRGGVLVTVDRVFLGGDGQPFGASGPPLPDGATAVDMETAAIAAVAEARGVGWDALRAISDVAGTLTPDVAALLSPDGRVRLGAVLRLVLRRPEVARRLFRLGVDTNRALKAATHAVVRELAAEGIGA
jgi:adenosylhomocysteine nucleosidase